jgi:hypothetical protein
MADRKRLGDYAMDMFLFAGAVSIIDLDKSIRCWYWAYTQMQMAAAIYTMQHYIVPMVGNLADPDREKNEQAKIRAEAHLQRLRRHKRQADEDDDSADSRPLGVAELALNEYESQVAMEMVAPQDIHVGFDGEQ